MGLLKRVRKGFKKVVRATVTRPAKFVYRQEKKHLRMAVKVTSKAAPYITAVAAGAASYLGGPVAGAAVGAIGSEASYRLRKEYGREVGESYKVRTDRARSVRRRSAKAAGVGLGAGAVASGVTAAFTGGNVLVQAGLGQGGSQLLGVGGPGIFTPAIQTSGYLDLPLSGISGGASVAEKATIVGSTFPAVTTPTAAAAAASTTGPGIWTTLAGAAVTGATSGVSRGLSTQRGTGSQSGPADSWLAAAELAALQAAGMGGGGAGGQVGDGFPNIQNTPGSGGTDWSNLLLIAAAVYVGAKILKVA